MKNTKTIWVAMFALVLRYAVFAQEGVVVTEPLNPDESPELQALRQRVLEAHPDMDLVSLRGSIEAELAPRQKPTIPQVAIFVKNQSTMRTLDDEVDPLRNMIAAELASAGVRVLDPQEIAAAFHRYKVTTDEERQGLIDGLFTGGSVVRVAQMVECDYLVLVSILHADVRARVMSGQNINTYQMRLSARALDANRGTSVWGQNFRETYPVNTANVSVNHSTYYRDLLAASSEKIGVSLAGSIHDWRPPEADEARVVSFSVRTTIDELVDGLELGVRAPNELLNEMRRVVGGATVFVDGAAVGSSPGVFRTSRGLHQVRVSRQWMQPWQETVNIEDGLELNVALELSSEGLENFQSLEGFRAAVALAYAEAAFRQGIEVNFDTAAWRDVMIGDRVGTDIKVGVPE